MEERANLIDGEFKLNSEIGKGTEIVVKIPQVSPLIKQPDQSSLKLDQRIPALSPLTNYIENIRPSSENKTMIKPPVAYYSQLHLLIILQQVILHR